MCVNGATYLFGVYSNDVKSSLGYDQTTLNLVSFFKDLGGNLGIISGLINEITPPWVVLAIGAVMNFFGYFMIWLAVTGRTAKPRVWQMCLYIWIGADSQAFANTGSLITCVQNFPESRGIVLGLLKGFVGLSGAIMTQLYHALHGNDTKSLILLIAWLPAAVSIMFLPTIRLIKNVRLKNEVDVFYSILYVSLGLAGFLMIIIVIQNKLTFTRIEYVGSAVFVLILVFSPLAIVIKQECYSQKQFKTVVENPLRIESTPLPAELQPKTSPSRARVNPEKPISCAKDVFNPPDRVSIWNYLGRVTSGFVSEIFLTKYKFPRPLMLTLVLLFSCVGHLLIAFSVPNSLYIASMIIGFCFGAQWPLLFAIVSEIFGLKYYSTLFQFGAVASPVGAYILNVKVAGKLYDKEALRQMAAKGLIREEGQDLTCSGGLCYRLSFIIITVATIFGCAVSLILVFRTREFYKGDIYRKFKEEDEAIEIKAPTSTTIASEPTA
ncbi:NUCLEAR FUSION DEFECTIVE 4-like [Olea europaea subsp. europaea]|uniref:NUCLEAR FUSION DEFECTIVE 4-like n=1 Tax=Olea europaea subsp. europaea TaxID=158383 RepID=A0A8S0QF29_OLEEU|nr:NUCLEAR FUSION DEFECTIVE 4-like [Olea europaea subsp. europaea]